MSRYKKNISIDLTSQNRRARWYFKYFNKIVEQLVSPEDMITMYYADKILHSTPFLYKSLTRYMNDSNAARMIQLTMNLAVITWQWAFSWTSTWFMYFVTSLSGLKKIYECVFVNPIYGLLYFGTFYIKLIGGTSDVDKFNKIAKALHLPKHSDMGASTTFSKIVNNVPETILGYSYSGYSIQVKGLLKSIAANIVAAPSQLILHKVLITSLKETNSNISKISDPAVYISDRDKFDFDDIDIQAQLSFIKKENINIKKYIKKYINPKKKQLKKQKFMEIVQVKAPEGHVICLDKCKNRVKTKMGCYCEGDCGKTTFLNKKSWCWVDPSKCKKGKYLDTVKGRAYDYCDKKYVTKSKKCFNGNKYTDCITK